MAETGYSAGFPTTHWSRVIIAGDRTAPGTRAALAGLCEAYWYPIYALIRRRGHAADEASDLTQEYFTRLLEKPVIAAADQTKGRFRAFLKTDCQHFLIDQHRRERVRARVLNTVSIDPEDAESRYGFEPADHLTPERLFDRTRAITLLDRVLTLLGREYTAKGRAEILTGSRSS
jgi:RNA polymerase sigma-70 factor (ECF subfamily)